MEVRLFSSGVCCCAYTRDALSCIAVAPVTKICVVDREPANHEILGQDEAMQPRH